MHEQIAGRNAMQLLTVVAHCSASAVVRVAVQCIDERQAEHDAQRCIRHRLCDRHSDVDDRHDRH